MAISTTVTEIAPLGGSTLGGYKLGWLDVTVKAAQNEVVTITNASDVKTAFLQLVASGVAEANTISANAITCTSATTVGGVKGLLIYK
jgi:hypothetical protein